MSDKTLDIEIKVDAAQSEKTLGDLEKDFERLNEEIRNVPKNSKEFNKLQKELAQTGREIKNVELSFESLDNEQIASEMGGLAGAVGDVSAAFVLLGDDSEEIQKVAQNIEKALGVSMAFKGAIEGVSSARKLLNNSTLVSNTLEKISTFVKGGSAAASGAVAAGESARATATAGATAATSASTGALKLFRLALVATGIGAIVVGLGLLIANFDKVKESVLEAVEWLKEMRFKFQELGTGIKIALSVVFPFIGAIWAVTEALEHFGIINSKEADERSKVRMQEMKELHEHTNTVIDQLEIQQEAIRKHADEIVNNLDYEMEKRQAAGKEVTDIEKRKLIVLIETTKVELELIQEKIKAKQREAEAYDAAASIYYDAQVANIQEEAKLLEESLGENLKKLEIFEITQETKRKNEIERRKEAATKNSEIVKEQKEEELEIILEFDQAEIDAEKAKQDTIIQAEKDKQEALDELRKDVAFRNLSDKDQELTELREKFETEMEIAGEDYALRLELEEEYQANLDGIKQKFEKAEKDRLKEEEEAKAEKRKQNISDSLNAASQLNSSLTALNDAKLQNDLAGAAGNEAATERIRKKAFERDKKLKIGQAIMSGIQAVQSALAVGPPFSIPLSIAAGITAAANVSKIKSTRFQSGGNITGSGLNNSQIAAGGADVPQVTNTTTTIGGDTKVFVSEQDISDTQNKVEVAENLATL